MSYQFEDMPDYGKLSYLLDQILLNQDEVPKARCNIFNEELKHLDVNVRSMSTLQINFDWENMSNTSMDSEDFQNIEEFDGMGSNMP